MTASFPKGVLWSSSEKVADDIDRAISHGFGTVYTPWLWRWILFLVREVPEIIFVRTRL